MRWFKDEDFLRDKVPMSKEEVRFITSALLEIKEGDKILDIGTGTGSMSCQFAELGADVYGIESKDLAYWLTLKNFENLGLKGKFVKGFAPEDLDNLGENYYDKVFIGGSRGRLEELFVYLDKNLKDRGILIANFISLDNLSEFRSLLKENSYSDISCRLIQVSKEDKLGLMRGENPIYIIKGVKND